MGFWWMVVFRLNLPVRSLAPHPEAHRACQARAWGSRVPGGQPLRGVVAEVVDSWVCWVVVAVVAAAVWYEYGALVRAPAHPAACEAWFATAGTGPLIELTVPVRTVTG